MAITIDEMIEMGLHFGHQAKKWNPKMAPYIYTKRNGVHIIDLIQTCLYMRQATRFLTESAAKGDTFLFVGTKRQAAGLIAKVASESNSFYVNQRWLGGMLTNWQTLRSSIAKLNRLEARERSGELDSLPKKEAAVCRKQRDRLAKYLGGVRDMARLPDVVIIVGQPEEMNAVRECRKLGIRTVTVLDTNCDPTVADLFVPANDDSATSLRFVLHAFLDAILRGRAVAGEGFTPSKHL